jgi:hypothetical protein
VFDVVQSSVVEAKAGKPYDSAKSVYTMQIPDQSDANTATIIFVNAVSGKFPASKGDFVIAGKTVTGMQPKPTSPVIITGVPADGAQVSLTGTLNAGTETLDELKFTPVKGAIYEVLCVGHQKRTDNDARYKPQFMVIRTNPIRN